MEKGAYPKSRRALQATPLHFHLFVVKMERGRGMAFLKWIEK
jgi:hypothetical protein